MQFLISSWGDDIYGEVRDASVPVTKDASSKAFTENSVTIAFTSERKAEEAVEVTLTCTWISNKAEMVVYAEDGITRWKVSYKF